MRQFKLRRYETAFLKLHMLRTAMVLPDQDRICPDQASHVEVDETMVGERTRGEGRGVHHKVIVVSAVEVRYSQSKSKFAAKRHDGRYASRVRLAVLLDRRADSLCGFVQNVVTFGSIIVTDDWSDYAGLRSLGHTVCQPQDLADGNLSRGQSPALVSLSQ